MQQELEGNGAAGVHLLEGLYRIAVLIKRTAADIGHFGRLVDGGCFTGSQQALGLRHLQKHFRQRRCLNNIILGAVFHDWMPPVVKITSFCVEYICNYSTFFKYCKRYCKFLSEVL